MSTHVKKSLQPVKHDNDEDDDDKIDQHSIKKSARKAGVNQL